MSAVIAVFFLFLWKGVEDVPRDVPTPHDLEDQEGTTCVSAPRLPPSPLPPLGGSAATA